MVGRRKQRRTPERLLCYRFLFPSLLTIGFLKGCTADGPIIYFHHWLGALLCNNAFVVYVILAEAGNIFVVCCNATCTLLAAAWRAAAATGLSA
jgi:hypothetical protein